MDISQIPKTFWHAVSLSILVLTFAFVGIAWRSTSLTIEIANTKIGVSQAASQSAAAGAALRQMSAELRNEHEKMAQLKEELMEMTAEKGSARPGAPSQQTLNSLDRVFEQAKLNDTERLKRLDDIQKALDEAQTRLRTIQ